VVIDSQSQDGSEEIARRSGAEVVQFSYDGGPLRKRQWALNNLPIATPWVLLLDADEVVPEALAREIHDVTQSPGAAAGYLALKEFHFLGRRFRFGGFSHTAVVLFQRGRARFERLLDDPADGLDMEVHERLIVDGPVGRLRTPLVHEDFKGLAAYIDKHNRYSTWEARVRWQFLATGRWGEDAIAPRFWGNVQERRRFLKKIAMRLPGEPWLWFGYHYILRGGFLEGRRGLVASQIRAQYIAQVRAKMFEMECQMACMGRSSARNAKESGFSSEGFAQRPPEVAAPRNFN
jgi:glycosyltransferase involved in cell wall biosynthesis